MNPILYPQYIAGPVFDNLTDENIDKARTLAQQKLDEDSLINTAHPDVVTHWLRLVTLTNDQFRRVMIQERFNRLIGHRKNWINQTKSEISELMNKVRDKKELIEKYEIEIANLKNGYVPQ